MKSGEKANAMGKEVDLKETPPPSVKDLYIGPSTGVGEKILKQFLPLVEMVVRKEYKSLPPHLAEYGELINIGLISVNRLLNEVAKNSKTYNSSYIAQAVKWAIKDELRTKYNWYGIKHSRDREDEEGVRYPKEISPDEDNPEFTEQEAKEKVFESILYLEDFSGEATPVEQMTVDELARLELTELKHALRRAIEKLPPKHKKVIELRFYEGKRGNDVAAELGVTPSRVSHMIQDAIEKVRQSLIQEGFG